jgi:hypothetical protein
MFIDFGYYCILYGPTVSETNMAIWGKVLDTLYP